MIRRSFIIFLTVFTSSYASYSQKILPIEEVVNYYSDPEKGLVEDGITYVKDVNNLLESFTGEWQATKGDWSYEVRIDKATKESDGIKKDILTFAYNITDSEGKIIESTFDEPENSPYKSLSWKYLDDKGNYFFNFWGGKSECGMDGDLIASIDEAGTIMSLNLVPYGEIFNNSNCVGGQPIYLFPRESLILNKQ